MLSQLLLEPFHILSSKSVVCLETLRVRTESLHSSFLPIYVVSASSFKNLSSLSSLCLRTPFHFVLNTEQSSSNSTSPKSSDRKTKHKSRRRKSEKGFFNMLAKTFRRESKVFKRIWKEDTFLAKLAIEVYLIRTREGPEQLKFDRVRTFASLLEDKRRDWNGNVKHKTTGRKQSDSEGKHLANSNVSNSQGFYHHDQSGGNLELSKRVIHIGDKDKHRLFPKFAKDIESQLWGRRAVIPSEVPLRPPVSMSSSKWLEIDLEKPQCFEYLEKDKKSKKKRKKERMGRDKYSVMNQSFLQPFQQVLGTLSFEFEEMLVGLFRCNYKMVKGLFGAKGHFSLLETPLTDYLRFRVEHSLQRTFGEDKQNDTKRNSKNVKENKKKPKKKEKEKKKAIVAQTKQKTPETVPETKELVLQTISKDIQLVSEEVNPQSEPEPSQLQSDSDQKAISAQSEDVLAQSDLDSKVSDQVSRKHSKSFRSIAFGSSANIRRQSYFSRQTSQISKQSILVTKARPTSPQDLKVHIKQHRSTTRNFQRPFIKPQIRFDSASEFSLKSTLSKSGRRALIPIFKSHYHVLQKINSYLKAFFEMEKFSLREPTPKKKNRKRRNQPKKEPLPFSAVLHFARFRQLPHLEAFVVRPFCSLPCVVLLKGEELWICLTDLARERKLHLELKQTIFKPDKGLVSKHSIPQIFKGSILL